MFDLSELEVAEVIQAGDNFLLRYSCPRCKEENLEGFPLSNCYSCKLDHSQYVVDIPSRVNFRLLCGTRRKNYISKKTIRALQEIQKGMCAYCDEPMNTGIHVEHIVPLAVGGTNSPSNLCLACPDCNRRAGRKAFHSFFAKRDYVRMAILNKSHVNRLQLTQAEIAGTH